MGEFSSCAVATVLVVDDGPQNVALLCRLMTALGYRVRTASDGELALASVAEERPDIVLLDIEMPKMDGLTVCRTLKSDPATRLIPVILVTGLADTEDQIRGIEAGADDFLGKPFNSRELEARVRSLVRLKRYTDDLDSAQSVILSLGLTIEARDPYTHGHCQRLARFSAMLGRSLALTEDAMVALHRGAFLHDVGKVGIPDAVLLKPGRLDPVERAIMEQHTVIGERLCGNLRILESVRPIVRHHHERLDGSGYPDRLKGDEIPVLAQIIGIVDVYDALTTVRPYKRPMSHADAVSELRTEVRNGWRSHDLIEAFIHLHPERAGESLRAGVLTRRAGR